MIPLGKATSSQKTPGSLNLFNALLGLLLPVEFKLSLSLCLFILPIFKTRGKSAGMTAATEGVN
jgi:hypothetical protein